MRRLLAAMLVLLALSHGCTRFDACARMMGAGVFGGERGPTPSAACHEPSEGGCGRCHGAKR
jgi:hypothetical protein